MNGRIFERSTSTIFSGFWGLSDFAGVGGAGSFSVSAVGIGLSDTPDFGGAVVVLPIGACSEGLTAAAFGETVVAAVCGGLSPFGCSGFGGAGSFAGIGGTGFTSCTVDVVGALFFDGSAVGFGGVVAAFGDLFLGLFFAIGAS